MIPELDAFPWIILSGAMEQEEMECCQDLLAILCGRDLDNVILLTVM